MPYWILKTEPSAYSFDQLERDGTAVWDGVKNPVALRNLRAMVPGDQLMVYHTGDEKSVIGFAEVTRAAYPDPKKKDAKLVVIELKPVGRLPRPVSLAAIRAEKALAGLALVRQPRLSVVAADAAQWKRLRALGGA